MWRRTCALATLALSLRVSAPSMTGVDTHDEPQTIFDDGLQYRPSGGNIEPQYENAEHISLGNAITLPYETGAISGADFNYTAGGYNLSYGQIVSLAGDFYGNWKTMSRGCVEQISDNWDTNPEQSIQLAIEVADNLAKDKGGYLGCILSTMALQRDEVLEGTKDGQDPAQVFKSLSSKYDTLYGRCTNLGYAWIALCNWDHFGDDAVKAYSAVHSAALRQALEGHQTHARSNLTQAYFLEAFAQHYLSDSFSAGHIRIPRRHLHWTYSGISDQHMPELSLYPADSCARKMHDEDNANGLWVTNALGESWAAYGDKQMWGGKSARNLQQTAGAMQMSVMEVWDTYMRGVVPNASDYAVLKKIPMMPNTSSTNNFVPMFQSNTTHPDLLQFRTDINVRNASAALRTMQTRPSYSQWQALVSNISKSGIYKQMYPYSRGFSSGTEVVHVRVGIEASKEGAGAGLVVNRYGDVDAGGYGRYWGMRGQEIVGLEGGGEDVRWVAVNGVGRGVVSLVGESVDDGTKQTMVHHVGLNVSAFGTNGRSILWQSSTSSGSISSTGDTLQGKSFSEDTNDTAIVRYMTSGVQNPMSSLELWIIPEALDHAPGRSKQIWESPALNFMLPHQMRSDDTFHTFVGYGQQANQSNAVWYFSTWRNGYDSQVLTVINESMAFPAQAILSGKIGQYSLSAESQIIRLFYGEEYSTNGTLRVDILTPSRYDSDSSHLPVISIPDPPITQEFPITWSASASQSDYLLWFLADVDGDGLNDLVALVNSVESESEEVDVDVDIGVLVFPGMAEHDGEFAFGTPVFSPIVLDPAKGEMLSAGFMTHIASSRAQYTYPPSNSNTSLTGSEVTTNAAIMTLFDNFGVLGVRILAPVKALVDGTGTYEYELKGQTPAVAGQVGDGVGWRDVGGRQEGVGFVFD